MSPRRDVMRSDSEERFREAIYQWEEQFTNEEKFTHFLNGRSNTEEQFINGRSDVQSWVHARACQRLHSSIGD